MVNGDGGDEANDDDDDGNIDECDGYSDDNAEYEGVGSGGDAVAVVNKGPCADNTLNTPQHISPPTQDTHTSIQPTLLF